MLGVNSDEDREAIKKVMIEENITWPSWWDQSTSGPIYTTWQVELRPAIHILDEKGVIRYKNILPEEIDDAIDSLLAELSDK